jgi:hypothetical protein
MMLPRLSAGVTRGTSIVRHRGRLRPSHDHEAFDGCHSIYEPMVTTYCRCSCTDGADFCESGTASTLAAARSAAYRKIQTDCNTHGGVSTSPCTYNSTPCYRIRHTDRRSFDDRRQPDHVLVCWDVSRIRFHP